MPADGADGQGLLASCLSCLGVIVRCMCCLDPTDLNGEGGQRLLGPNLEPSERAIEAAASPPRLPITGAASAPPKGSSLQPNASPPMPPPFFPTRPARHKRGASDASRGSSGGSSPGGGSPKARRGGGRSGTADDEDVCPTCLDPYGEDNPRVLTRCGHHFHLPCLYEWLERSETCPVCAKPMHFEEVV